MKENDNRNCGTCNECCMGWLEGEAYGHKFSPEIPCSFLSNNQCSIYSKRPECCKSFSCEWLLDKNLPNDFRPDFTKVIPVRYQFKDMPYYVLVGNYTNINEKIYQWMLNEYLQNNTFFVYYTQGFRQIKGSESFVEFARQLYPKYYTIFLQGSGLEK